MLNMFYLENIDKVLRMFRQPKRKDINKFLLWARKHAVIINKLDGLTVDIERFSFLDGLLENKRVVYLGEEDHWIHEKSDYRLLMIRYLVSRGWRYIGEELGWSDGIRIDRYLETGDISHLECIATYGYKGVLREDRDDKPTGILKGSTDNYPVAEFKSEQLRLTRALRDVSVKCETSSDRIHFFGFDIDAVTGGGYGDVEELLSQLKNEPSIIDILKSLKRIQNETLVDEIKRLDKVLEAISLLKTDLKKLLGDKQYYILQEHILTLRDSFKFNNITIPAKDYEEVNAAMAAREEVIHRHVTLILSQMKPDDKLILMGHNRHLSKDLGTIKNAGAAPPGGYRVPSIGTYINRLLPGQVLAIWEIHGQGRGSQPFPELSQNYVSVPGSLNAILAEVGPNFLLPTEGVNLFEQEMDIVGIYNAIYRTKIAKQADAIFFISKVSPLKL